MAIESTPFGPVRLTGEHAANFLRQISNPQPNPAAQEALRRGNELLRQIAETGRVVINVNPSLE